MLGLEKYFWKNNKNKKTTERIYIPSLLLDYDFAAAGWLEAVVALLPGFGEGTGSGEESSSSLSASSTWQVKEI